jgi:hypothetical protein
MQTAVEYLIEQLQAPCRGIPSHIVEQAKEMEKQQIIDAFDEGEWPTQLSNTAEEYYNETFKNK